MLGEAGWAMRKAGTSRIRASMLRPSIDAPDCVGAACDRLRAVHNRLASLAQTRPSSGGSGGTSSSEGLPAHGRIAWPIRGVKGGQAACPGALWLDDPGAVSYFSFVPLRPRFSFVPPCALEGIYTPLFFLCLAPHLPTPLPPPSLHRRGRHTLLFSFPFRSPSPKSVSARLPALALASALADLASYSDRAGPPTSRKRTASSARL